MKKLLIVWLCALLLTGCGKTETPPEPPAEPGSAEAPAGVARLLEPREDGSFFLLLEDRLQTDRTQPPQKLNSLCSYDPEGEGCTLLWQGEGEILSPYTPAAAAGEALYFCTEARLHRLAPDEEGWTLHALAAPGKSLGTVSPDGRRCAFSEGNAVVVTLLKDGRELARFEELPGVRRIRWSEDGRCLTLDFSRGTAAAVCDTLEGTCRRLFAGGELVEFHEEALWKAARQAGITMEQGDALLDMGFDLAEIARMTAGEADALLTRGLSAAERQRYEEGKAKPAVPAPAGWVEISDVHLAGERYLVLTWLCESQTLFTVRDLEGGGEITLETGGDADILDVRGSRILYQVTDGKNAAVHSYDCADGSRRVWQSRPGFVTAGCLGEGEALVCRYDPETRRSGIEKLR